MHAKGIHDPGAQISRRPDTRAQMRTDEPHDGLAPDAPPESVDTHVVVAPVDEFRQVYVHHHALAGLDVHPGGLDLVVRALARSEAVPVVAEGEVDPRLQRLRPCLLDQPIRQPRWTELTMVAVRFGWAHSAYRPGPVPASDAPARPSPFLAWGLLRSETRTFTARTLDLRRFALITRASRSLARSPSLAAAPIRFLHSGSQLCSTPPPHTRSPHASALRFVRRDQMTAGLAPAGMNSCSARKQKGPRPIKSGAFLNLPNLVGAIGFEPTTPTMSTRGK